jgi:lipopolysaccharide/colanic/teichoic acid biosynthesis glycosyltransferase
MYYGIGMTLTFIIDIVAWCICAFIIDWCIARHEAIYAHEQWNKEYGREAWEANIPTETLDKKIKNFGTMGLSSDMLSGNTQEFIADGMSGFGRITKRLLDFVVSGCCLILFSPLFLLCYILIKLDDGGPAIYKQERIGRFGRPFQIYKFRSMRVDAEASGPALSHADGQTDPRLTKIGGWLRTHHLDELPQLWNVFTGDMAFIGYRPERKFYIDQIMEHDPRYAFLYQIRPGVTSYATLNYGYTDTMEKMLRRLELDLFYLKNRSWWFDCKVLFLTFVSIIFGKKF